MMRRAGFDADIKRGAGDAALAFGGADLAVYLVD